jgi:hypothetical protein
MKIVIDGFSKSLGGYAGVSSGKFFPDVEPGVWYATHLASAKKLNIVSGYPDGTFRGENNISFVEAAKIITNTKEVDKSSRYLQNFEVGKNDQWYQPYVDYLEAWDAIPPSITKMDQLVTRAEMVEMMYRLSEDNIRTSTFTIPQLNLTMTYPSTWGRVEDLYNGTRYDFGYFRGSAPRILLEDVSSGKEWPAGLCYECEQIDSITIQEKIRTNPDMYIAGQPTRVNNSNRIHTEGFFFRSYVFYYNNYKVTFSGQLGTLHQQDFEGLYESLNNVNGESNNTKYVEARKEFDTDPVAYIVKYYPNQSSTLLKEVKKLDSAIESLK